MQSGSLLLFLSCLRARSDGSRTMQPQTILTNLIEATLYRILLPLATLLSHLSHLTPLKSALSPLSLSYIDSELHSQMTRLSRSTLDGTIDEVYRSLAKREQACIWPIRLHLKRIEHWLSSLGMTERAAKREQKDDKIIRDSSRASI